MDREHGDLSTFGLVTLLLRVVLNHDGRYPADAVLL
jgi:hypothetical protein